MAAPRPGGSLFASFPAFLKIRENSCQNLLTFFLILIIIKIEVVRNLRNMRKRSKEMASSKWFEQREKEFSALYRDFEKQYQASGPSREVWQAMSDEEKATVRQNLAPLRARATALAQERDEMHRLSQSRLTRFSIHANRRSEYY